MRYGVRREPASSAFLLAPCEILDVVDEIGGIARMPRFQDSPQVSDPFAIGHPLYSTEGAIRSKYSHDQLSVAAAGMCPEAKTFETIRDGLLRRSGVFAAAIEEGSAELHIRISRCDLRRPHLAR